MEELSGFGFMSRRDWVEEQEEQERWLGAEIGEGVDIENLFLFP